ncbi:MAG TPA: putative toxin-antitoxin system toxin component, PIN family [Acidobacteriaceae bacterium]|nr:putative toxin-antitoxin system toxin component, PIN family [Acidobacteriaceae bacterium]
MTSRLLRVALDTNMLVSTIIAASSVPAEAIAKVLQTATVLVSLETWDEMEEVLMREKFDRYQAASFRRAYLDFLQESVDFVSVHSKVTICRDVKDDKLLALALDGNADFIVTGDKDLLVLNPFEGIPIITPLDYLAR